MKITERDVEVLKELEAHERSMKKMGVGGEKLWARPLDCGGTNGSHHSQTLSKLARHGLAEQKKRGGFSRGSKVYRITSKGREIVHEETQADLTYKSMGGGDGWL